MFPKVLLHSLTFLVFHSVLSTTYSRTVSARHHRKRQLASDDVEATTWKATTSDTTEHIKQLQKFHMLLLLSITGIRWQGRVSNLTVLERAVTTSTEAMHPKAQHGWGMRSGWRITACLASCCIVSWQPVEETMPTILVK